MSGHHDEEDNSYLALALGSPAFPRHFPFPSLLRDAPCHCCSHPLFTSFPQPLSPPLLFLVVAVPTYAGSIDTPPPLFPLLSIPPAASCGALLLLQPPAVDRCSICSHLGDMSKKIVVKLDLHDGKDKQKAMKAVSVLVGIDALSVDMAAHKMTVVGTVDPVDVVSKLRKSSWAASIDSVGPAKEPEKRPEKKGEDGKKDGAGEAKKEGDGEKKDGGEAKKDVDGEKKTPTPPPPTEQQLVAELMNQYRAYQYNPYMSTPHYVVQSMEENPNSCAIC